MGTVRSHRIHLGLALAGATASLSACGSAGPTVDDVDAAWQTSAEKSTQAPFRWSPSPYGLEAGLEIEVGSPRQFSGATFATDSDMKPVAMTFWSQRQEAISEAPTLPFPAQPGDNVLVNALLTPDCTGSGGLPLVTVKWTGQDGAASETFTPGDVGQYREALDSYCTQVPSFATTGSETRPDGTFTITAKVFNPATHPVTLDLPATTAGGNRWHAVHVNIAPQASTTVTFTGTGDGCQRPYPWENGAASLDDKPLHVGEAAAEAC